MTANSQDTKEVVTMQESSQWLLRYRRLIAVVVHVVLFAAAHAGAFALRFEFGLPAEYFPLWFVWLAASIFVKTVVFAWFGMFSGMWRYTGANDLITLTRSAAFSSLVYAAFIVLAGYRSHPRSIFIIDFLLTVILVGGLRFSVRTLWQLATLVNQRAEGDRKRMLIVGAGNAGELLVRELRRLHAGRYEPVGFVDDDRNKQGNSIHGVRVLGTLADAPSLVKSKRIDEVVIAIPSATGQNMRRIVDVLKPAGVTLRTMPGIEQLIEGRVTINQLRRVNIEDLLGRDPVVLDTASLNALLTDQVVLVTGAGGSIGSELCRQASRFGPCKLLLVERSEPSLFEIHRELRARHPELEIVPCLADIGDSQRMRSLFAQHTPAVVVHAAAHKHVPMMEWNPGEALKNNVGGTRCVADLSDEFGVQRFVMVSTDKAVNPTSIMGATKRVAELYIQALSERSRTRFVAVRFGNVLGSAGSVVPIFQEQIAAGGPVLVTHPEMRRYFMTIPEASQLVLQAAALGRGGEIFVLDMGQPVKIVDLARDLIALSGLVPDRDIAIQFSGLRPGEKLFEELSTAEENAEKTRHPKIFIGRLKSLPWERVVKDCDGLLANVEGLGVEEIVGRLRAVVPEIQRPEPNGQVIPLRPHA